MKLLQQQCFEQSFHQRMTLGSGMVSGQRIIAINPERPSSNSRYHQTLLDCRHCGIAVSTLMQLELYLESFLLGKVQNSPRMGRLSW